MKFIAMKFREKQAEWLAKRRINWYVNSVVVRQEESLEVIWYVHLLNSCKQDWFPVLSVLENLFATIKLQNSGIIKVFLRLHEAGCYHNCKLYHPYESSDIARESNHRIASIRRYCNESHNAVSAKNIHTTLKERPVRGTTASVCVVQKKHSTL